MLSATISYQNVNRNLDAALDRTAERPMIARATEDYLAEIGSIKSIEGFIENDKVYRYAMKAFGLAEMTYAKGFMRKLLQEGVESADSMANKLTDPRYKEFAETFDFAGEGGAVTTRESARGAVVEKYTRLSLEETTGEDSEGARLALYFQRQAPTVQNYYDILGDEAMLKVVQTAFGLPEATASMDIDAQKRLLEERFDLADLQDPAKLDETLRQFTALYDAQNSTQSQATSPALAILGGGSSSGGMDSGLLLSLQSFRATGSF